MDIVVCVKQVADPEALVEVREGGLDVEEKRITSFFDEVAVEQALQLRDRFGGQVTAITAGSGKAIDAVRRAIAMGANRALMVDDPALSAADGIGVARALAAALKDEPCDLLICGRASLDDEAGVVGPALAEFLGLPHLSEVVGLEADEDGAWFTAQRVVEGGRALERCPLPLLVTAGKGLAEPRVPPVTGVMKAMRAPVEKKGLADLGLASDDVAAGWAVQDFAPPPQRPAVTMVAGEFPDNVASLVATLKDRGVLR